MTGLQVGPHRADDLRIVLSDQQTIEIDLSGRNACQQIVDVGGTAFGGNVLQDKVQGFAAKDRRQVRTSRSSYIVRIMRNSWYCWRKEPHRYVYYRPRRDEHLLAVTVHYACCQIRQVRAARRKCL